MRREGWGGGCNGGKRVWGRRRGDRVAARTGTFRRRLVPARLTAARTPQAEDGPDDGDATTAGREGVRGVVRAGAGACACTKAAARKEEDGDEDDEADCVWGRRCAVVRDGVNERRDSEHIPKQPVIETASVGPMRLWDALLGGEGEGGMMVC